jgi:protease I
MTDRPDSGIPVAPGRFGSGDAGRIGVLIEDHFDQTEFFRFNEYLPARGYQVEYLTHLWGQPSLVFRGNADDGVISAAVRVDTEISAVRPDRYAGVICIGAYAMDRLRYQAEVRKGAPNTAPAVVFLRELLAAGTIPVGTICHSMWLFCADRSLLAGRRVTCAHNIICDVENAGGEVVYAGGQTADIVVDRNVISARHPGVVDQFLATFHEEITRADRDPTGFRVLADVSATAAP